MNFQGSIMEHIYIYDICKYTFQNLHVYMYTPTKFTFLPFLPKGSRIFFSSIRKGKMKTKKKIIPTAIQLEGGGLSHKKNVPPP